MPKIWMQCHENEVCAAMSAVMLIYLNISVSAHLWLFRLCKSSPLITFFFSCVPDGLLTQSNKKASWDLSVQCPQLSNWLLCKTKCDTHTHTHVQTPCFSFIMRVRLKTQTSCGSRQTTLSHTSLISCSLTSLHLYFLPSLWSTCQTQTPTKYFV